MKGLSFNIYYYKNYFLCKLFPNYIANSIVDFDFTPLTAPKQQKEIEFEKSTKHNILKIPTEGYKERAKKFEENNKERNLKLTRVPELPEEITVLEFLPEENIEKKECTILCSHGIEGRGTNFFKFISKLIHRGFRVLALDYPMHGNTDGNETGCHVFGYSLNCILYYLKEPIILLAHSLSNEVVSMNYYISDENTKNKIKGYVGISVLDKFRDSITIFGKNSGLDDYSLKFIYGKKFGKTRNGFKFFYC